MKSTKCVACGFVGWSDVEYCKACGAPLNQQHVAPAAPAYGQWDQSEGQEKGLAIFALILGIISFFTFGLLIVGAIAGIIVAVKAMGRVRREPWRYGGRGIAIAGLVMSILSLTSAVPMGIIAAIAIPNLLASRMAANEGSAIYSLRQIFAAESMYYENFEKYGTLEELAAQNLIDPRLGAGTKNGYNFTVVLTNEEVEGFAVVGVPITYRSTGTRSFYVDESAVIRAADNNGGPPSKMDAPLEASSEYFRRDRRLDDRPQTVY